MRSRTSPLLCELHAHTRWSDGELSIAELVDLHGRAGFDVLGITDHVVRPNDPWKEIDGAEARAVDETTWDAYLADIAREARRAAVMYGLLVVPGLELTFNDFESVRAAHAVAFGLRSFVALDGGIAEAMKEARTHGAALVAAHPYDGPEPASTDLRVTRRFSRDRGLQRLAHRFELFNRSQLFGWVAEAGLPAVACGDVHRVEHLSDWRTLIPSERDEEAVLDYLRSPRPVYLTRVEPEPARIAA